MRRCAGCKAELDPKIALIGFCGAPWTVATYMVAGQGTPDQAPARMMAYRHPDAFARIIDTLVENSIQYLLGQLKAGADALQIFDTWAGVLPPREFQRWSIEPTRRIVEGVRAVVPDAKIIGFPRGAGALLPAYVDATGVDAVSIDWAAEPSLIRERVQSRVAVQGNLDPLALIAGGAALDRAVDDVLENYARGRLIFNLGHGILQETPIAHVEQMIARVRAYRGIASPAFMAVSSRCSGFEHSAIRRKVSIARPYRSSRRASTARTCNLHTYQKARARPCTRNTARRYSPFVPITIRVA